MSNFIKKCVMGGLVAASAVGAYAQANHLVISEVLMNSNLESGPADSGTGFGNSSEFLEIFNPTPNPISLDNYYITDTNEYTNPAWMTGGSFDFGPSDNVIRFPAGTTLNSGQVAVVAYTGSAFLSDFFGGDLNNFNLIPSSPLLFEVTDSDAAITNMIVLNSFAGTATEPEGAKFNFSRTNGGEFILLFNWDGTSDLVKDVDIVAWDLPDDTSSNRFQPKDSSDVGLNNTPYLADAGTHVNLTIDPAPHVLNRISLTETGETATGGNGLTGHDESLETVATSFEGKSMGDATPGTTLLTVPGANMVPEITAVERDLEYPTSSQSVTVSVTATDSDGTIQSVEAFLDTGSGFPATGIAGTSSGTNTFAVNLGAIANNTLVKYYIKVTDDDGDSSYFPALAPGDFKVFRVADDHVTDGEVVINEIMYNNPGTDYEFVELHNATDAEIDVSYFRFADRNHSYFTLPEGASIPAHGYLVLTQVLDGFQANNPTEPNVEYYDWGTFGLNNGGGDQVVIVHPNSFEFGGTTTFLDEVNYLDVEPWPEIGGTERSLELIHPSLDNSLAESWRGAQPAATPGLDNTVLSQIIISDVTRDITFPAANQAVTISVSAVPLGSGTISAVRLFVDSGSGFAPVNMTLSSTPNVYTAQIGGFPDGTVVKYYIEAENNTADKETLPADAPTGFGVFLVGNDPIQSGDVVINEILYDNFGGDLYEYIELYNTTGSDIDLGYFRLTDNQNVPFTFAPGTIIAANSYVVLTENDLNFRASYGNLTVPRLDWMDAFGLANGGDTISLYHPNQYNFAGENTPLEQVTYTVLAPWPTWAEAPDVSGAESPNSTGRSIELINPLAQFPYAGESWDWTTNVVFNDGTVIIQGTPGAQNSVFNSSAVGDWTMY